MIISQMPSTSSCLHTLPPLPAGGGGGGGTHRYLCSKPPSSFLVDPLRGTPRHGSLTLRSRIATPILKPQNSRALWRLSQAKSGETEGSPITEGIILDERSLQQNLDRAIKEEDYVWAAKLRDDLRILQEDSKASVLAANARFYHAFRKGDLAAMHSLWAKGDNVYVIHPGAGRISGYNLVMRSWEIVCGADYEFPLRIDLEDVEVHVRGELGYVTCMEVVKTKGNSWGKQVATNVFEKVDGRWFMCIHHASHIDE